MNVLMFGSILFVIGAPWWCWTVLGLVVIYRLAESWDQDPRQ